MNLFHQLDMFCISETAFHEASRAEEGTPLGRKLADLSLLYKNYHDYLHSRFSYEGSLFDLLAGEIPKSEILRRSRIWIDGFNGMTPQKIRIVSALIRTAEEVTFTIPLPDAKEGLSNEIFARPANLYALLSEKSPALIPSHSPKGNGSAVPVSVVSQQTISKMFLLPVRFRKRLPRFPKRASISFPHRTARRRRTSFPAGFYHLSAIKISAGGISSSFFVPPTLIRIRWKEAFHATGFRSLRMKNSP